MRNLKKKNHRAAGTGWRTYEHWRNSCNCGAWSWLFVTLIHDPKICDEGNRFFFNRVPILGVLRALLLWAPLTHKIQNFSCSPQNYKPKPGPEFPISLTLSCKQISVLSGMCTHGLQSRIFWQQLSPSASGVRCSQSPCSSPGPMGRAALGHSVPEVGAQGGTRPSWNPTGPKPMVGPGSAWSHQCSRACREQGPETQTVKVQLQTKLPSQSSTGQEPRESQEPGTKARESFSPPPVLKVLSPGIPYTLEASRSVQLFNQWLCVSLPFFQAWAEVSSHPGWSIHPPQLR